MSIERHKRDSEVVEKTEEFVKERLSGDHSGHDWWHTHRVRQTAIKIAEEEGADLFIVELASLLHDIADWKFQEDKTMNEALDITRNWLSELEVEEEVIKHVCKIIETSSFKGAGADDEMETLEGKIVQDADRFDAMGAIGIARTFAYGGFKGREMYNPNKEPQMAESFEEYKKSGGTTINHFYEKLLLLKDRMNTKSGKKLAEKRHQFMKSFLEEFIAEWEGKK